MRRDRVDQRAIVRDQEDRAVVGVERVLERLAALDVEVVRRLVEHEQVRAGRDERREREPAALAAREHVDPTVDGVLREEEAPEDVAGLRRRDALARAGEHRLDHGQVVAQLGRVLREVARLDVVADLDAPGRGGPQPEQRLDQRRLARIRSGRSARPAGRSRCGTTPGPPACARRPRTMRPSVSTTTRVVRSVLGKPNASALLLARRLDALDPVELLLPRGGLARARARAELRDEALEPGDLLTLALERLGLVLQRLGALAAVGAVLHVVELAAAALELEHARRDALEEPAIVRDEQHGAVEAVELVLEPLERAQVEVVRRLVEQQQVGVRRERARERGARQLAARERLERALELLVDEPEPAQDRPEARSATRSRRRPRAPAGPCRTSRASRATRRPPAMRASSSASRASAARTSARPSPT